MYTRPPYQDAVEKLSTTPSQPARDGTSADEEKVSSPDSYDTSSPRDQPWKMADFASPKSFWRRLSSNEEYGPRTSFWPSVTQIVTYLAATLLIGYISWSLGSSFTHQKDLLDIAQSRPTYPPYDRQGDAHVSAVDVHTAPVVEPSTQKFAFAAFLAEWSPDDKSRINDTDMYFIQMRILTYQFVHDPITRTDKDIPFIALVMPNVDQWKKDQLRKDGATLVEVTRVESKTGYHAGRWKDLFSKFHVFTLEQYDKICFLDADTTLVAPMTGIFKDPGARIREAGHNPSSIDPEEAPLPEHYLMAGNYESAGHVANHRHDMVKRTQNTGSPDYFNAGFLVIKPSMTIYNYYLSVLNRPKGRKFNPIFEEQNLWNYAHRRQGNLPWTTLSWDWNVHGPREEDLQYGVKSLHGRLWLSTGVLKEFWLEKKHMMENYFAWMEEIRAEDAEEETFELENGGGIEDKDEKASVDGHLVEDAKASVDVHNETS